MHTYTGSQPTGTLKRIQNNIKYHTVENLKEPLIQQLFTSQPFELSEVLTKFELKVSHYSS